LADSRPLRIAHLLPNMAIGGRERMTNLLCRESAGLGLSPLLIGYDPLPSDAAALVPAAPYFQLDRKDPQFSAALRALLKEQAVDVVHAQGHIPAYYLARAVSGWRECPACIATMHVGMEQTWRWLWPVRKALRRMDHLTAVSTAMAGTYRRLSGKPVEFIANGIDCAEFAGAAAPYKIGEPFRFAMVSRLAPVKRHEDAVRAADQLVAAGLSLELHVAGEGECQTALAAMAASRPWLVLAGPIDDPASFLQDKHAFLLPSQAEGMPMALAEAMAAGLPAIVSDLPSLREMAGDAALYAPARSVGGLAGEMRRLMQENDVRERLSARARAQAWKFDLGGVAARYAAIYRRVA
jgi:glycosyltransferase involved in cell wall biosynthesis